MGRIVGIDLGTTYSCVAYFNEKKGVFEVLPNKAGEQTTPSVVGLNRNGEVLVGDAAKRQSLVNPENTVAEIKRKMGELENGKPYTVRFAGRDHSPEEISAYLLRDLKEAAERAIGDAVTAAVITVPAYFEEPQRQATMRAGKLAGLDVKRIINEPTAAAVAYGRDNVMEDEDEDAEPRPVRLLIYDLGGGTFDVSVIEVEKGNVRVRATHGNHYLGGVDFDNLLTNWTAHQIRARYGVDIEEMASRRGKEGERGRKALRRVRFEAENFKKRLSFEDTVTMDFAALITDPRSGDLLDVELEISSAEFEAMIAPKLEETLASVNVALSDAKMQPDDIDEVILVGGSTRIPLVKRMLAKHFGKEPRTDIHPDLCVALGAAHEALKHVDVSTVAPEVRSVYEEKIAESSAVIDVTGHSLGIAVEGKYMSVLIKKQSPIPIQTSSDYATMFDNQRVVNIQVFQGENRLVADNTCLREFLLEDLPRRPAGGVRIVVSFALDANGCLTVTARDAETGKQREIVIRDVHIKGDTGEGFLLPSAGGPRPPMPDAVTPSLPPTAKIPERYRRFVDQANQIRPRLTPGAAQRLNVALDALNGAVSTGDQEKIQVAGDALMETLFDVR
ncbi:Hsp70 family protein [Sorangium sp. So ce861]|uniref:Hsp70 family protein n=1 Tax=Sorangium sp. So ce861 TaxID=3133323 RepID=UPI003F641FE8